MHTDPVPAMRRFVSCSRHGVNQLTVWPGRWSAGYQVALVAAGASGRESLTDRRALATALPMVAFVRQRPDPDHAGHRESG
jgi:hypothetical protein